MVERLIRKERKRERKRKEKGGDGRTIDGKKGETGPRFRVTRARWASPCGETCQNRSGTVHVSLACSPAAATSTTITDPVPSGSFLEQRKDFVGFLVCHGSLLLPYSKRAATLYNGGIRRNLEREVGTLRNAEHSLLKLTWYNYRYRNKLTFCHAFNQS